MRLKCFVAIAGSAFALMSATAASAAQMDAINPDATPPFVFYGGPNDIGWSYTANATYELTGINTLFEAVPNGTGSRTITEQIWDADPSVAGRTLLGEATFTGDSFSGGLLGGTFSPVHIDAGTTYFVDFLNTIGMGVNLGQWADTPSGPAPSAGATTNVGTWWGDFHDGNGWTHISDGGSNYSTATGNVSFAEPILFFEGNPVSTGGVPEPSTWAMMLIGFAGLGWAVRRRAAAPAAL
jgi:hypothetical protein